MAVKYNRILLKLSGEALSGDLKSGFDFDVVTRICKSIKKCTALGTQVAIVIGGGNFWRGRSGGTMERTRADHMGMLATVINSLALQDTLEQLGVPAKVMTSLDMPAFAETFTRDAAVKYLENGNVVIFGCGTGNPFFSTDTAATLRAAEINADIIFKATMVDGVYDCDPHKFPEAKRFDSLTFSEVLSRGLAVMDSTAASMCKDNHLSLLVFSLQDPDNIVRALEGENIGTIVKEA